jgi:protease PrsW
MAQNVLMPQPHYMTRGKRGCLSTLFIGILLFVATTIVMFLTGNPNLYPTVILIGNFLIPVVFVVFLYDHQHLSSLAPETIGRSFGVGGILGVLGASILETILLPSSLSLGQGLSFSNALIVGLIEEGCKIAAVIFLARRMHPRTQIDGLLLGAAVGMGFAALESTGYAFTAFLASHGYVGASIFSTVLRGLLAPFGHGTWTAILGAVLFRQSGPRHFRFTIPVIITYLFVSLLHALWDGSPLFLSSFTIDIYGVNIPAISIAIGLVGIVVLTYLYQRAIRQRILTGQLPVLDS